MRFDKALLIVFGVALCSLLSRSHGLAQVAPIGSEFQVNTYTTGPQAQGIEGYFSRQLVSHANDGSFVIVWASSFDQDGDYDGVFGQKYDEYGNPTGAEFQVNTYTTNAQTHPAVTHLTGGGFVVVWEDYDRDGNYDGVFGQRFNSNGSKAGSDFAVNGFTTGYQEQPSIAQTADGGFVVVWRDYPRDGSGYGVFGRRFDGSGAPLGADFPVNTYTTDGQSLPNVSSSPAGGFVVVWASAGQDGDGLGIFGQRFAATGLPDGPEFPVNDYTTGDQYDPHVSMDAAGNFVVVFDGDGAAGTSEIFARRFDSSGTPLGGQFQVNSDTTGFQGFATVAVDDDGSFLVAFSDGGQLPGDSDGGIFVRHYDSTGTATGPYFVVNSYTTGTQDYPSVGTDGSGRFVVTWIDFNDHDGDWRGVFAQRLGLDSDGDGTADEADTCPADPNPDRLNSDCPDPDYIATGACSSGTVPDDRAGCCDGGDVCDPCPAQSDNTLCNSARSAGATIGSGGGTVQTDEVNGTVSATVVIPAGALDDDTSISVTENGPASDSFSLKKQLATADVLSVSMRPEGQAFNLPVEVTLRWDDRDMDGVVDRGVCEGGGDGGLPCDHDEDCASNSCSVNSNATEADLVLKRNNSRFSKDGFGVGPYTCADHAPGSACESATANCADDPGTNLATVAKCCDSSSGPTGTRTFGEWTFETCDFSEFLVGLDASALVPGKGSPKTDCNFEWAPNNPLNENYLDNKDLPNFKQVCHDGDPVCDGDGAVNGECYFEVSMCANVPDPRLDKDGVAQCTPTDMSSWRLIRPKPGSDDPADEYNTFLLLIMAAFGFPATSLDEATQVVGYAPAVSTPAACTFPAALGVALKDGVKKGRTVIKIRTETSPPPGKIRGAKDTDKLKLFCLPPE